MIIIFISLFIIVSSTQIKVSWGQSADIVTNTKRSLRCLLNEWINRWFFTLNSQYTVTFFLNLIPWERALCFKTDLKRISTIEGPSHHMLLCSLFLGFPAGSDGNQTVKNLPAMQETQVDPWVVQIPWRREWLPTPIFLPWKSHGQRSLAGYSPWGCKESDTAEQLTLSLFIAIEFILIHNWDVSVCFFKICTHTWKLDPKPCSLYKVIFISLFLDFSIKYFRTGNIIFSNAYFVL